MKITGTEIVHALSTVDVVKDTNCLQLDDQLSFDQEVYRIVPNDYTVI